MLHRAPPLGWVYLSLFRLRSEFCADHCFSPQIKTLSCFSVTPIILLKEVSPKAFCVHLFKYILFVLLPPAGGPEACTVHQLTSMFPDLSYTSLVPVASMRLFRCCWRTEQNHMWPTTVSGPLCTWQPNMDRYNAIKTYYWLCVLIHTFSDVRHL